MTQHVGAWMTRDLVTVAPDEPLFAAVERMAERRIRHVLVLDEDGALAGILSNRDVVRAVMLHPDRRLDLHGTLVREVMTRPPLTTIGPQESLGEAADRMLELHANALPVLEGGKVAGILTSDDVLRAVAKAEREHHPRPDA